MKKKAFYIKHVADGFEFDGQRTVTWRGDVLGACAVAKSRSGWDKVAENGLKAKGKAKTNAKAKPTK